MVHLHMILSPKCAMLCRVYRSSPGDLNRVEERRPKWSGCIAQRLTLRPLTTSHQILVGMDIALLLSNYCDNYLQTRSSYYLLQFCLSSSVVFNCLGYNFVQLPAEQTNRKTETFNIIVIISQENWRIGEVEFIRGIGNVWGKFYL